MDHPATPQLKICVAVLGERGVHRVDSRLDALDRGVRLVDVHLDDEFELVIGGNVGSALQLSHGADKRQFFGETKRAAIQAGRLKAGPRLAKDQRPYRRVGPEASEPA